MSFSSTRTVIPTAPRMASAVATSSSVASEPFAKAAAPAPTSAGMFGITRTTRAMPPSSRSIREVVTPAAMEMISLKLAVTDFKPASTVLICWGLMASRTTSAYLAAVALSAVVGIPKCFVKNSHRSGRASAAVICDGATVFVESSPRIKASPMLPAPMNAIVLFCRLMSFPFSKNSGADAHHRSTFFDRNFEIVRHAHRQFPQSGPITQFTQSAEVRPRFLNLFLERRDRHQSLHFQPRQLVDLAQRGVQVFGFQPELAGFA